MNDFYVTKSTLEGDIFVPSSKSHTLRAILFGALGKGRTTIQNYLGCSDTMAMVEACRQFGAKVDISPHEISIDGCDANISKAVIHAHNSGIVLRFCTAIGSLARDPIEVIGDKRPMRPLVEALRQLHVKVRGDEGAPIMVQGPIRSGSTFISGEDSQLVSALLIAASFAEGPIEIFVQNPGEKPWIDVTLSWLDRVGVSYQRKGYDWFHVMGGSRYPGFRYSVPGDFSSAAFPLAAAVVTGSALSIHNLDFSDAQGDKEIISVLQKMGALIEIGEVVQVCSGSRLHGVEIDINPIIDALPILAVVACFASGITRLYNGAIARKKESDRIHCMATELRKMGADIYEEEDGLVIKESLLHGAEVYSHQDHRVCMALAVAGLGATGETCIRSSECVAKTYPSFAQDMMAVGAKI